LGFIITLSKGDALEARAVIIACGKIPKRLGIPGEDKFMGRGVHVCSICDAPLYKDKTAAVVGGGNSAVEAALNLMKFAKKVYIITRTEKCRADDISLKELWASEKVERVTNHLPVEVLGDKFVNGLVVEDVISHQKRTLEVDGVFVEVGYAVNADIVKHLAKLNENNEIIVDSRGATSCEGLFAAGDATSTAFKQAIKSVDAGGTVLCFATTEPGVTLEVPVNDFWRNGITLLPSYGGSPRDLSVALNLIAAHRLPLKDMVTHRFPLEDAARGFALVAEARESIKVVLEPHTI